MAEAVALSARILSRLHESPSSQVYTTSMRDDDHAVVVVKRTKITSANDMKRFEKEIELLLECDHPAVIRPIGVLRQPPTYALVLPLMSNGTLFNVLHSSHASLKPSAKLGIASEVAAGLAHLHSRNILHRDVKSDNVLVNASGHVVLADLNAAERVECVTADIRMVARPTGGFFKQFVVGTLPYMAPELLLAGGAGALYTPSCDVYSFGILLGEIMSQVVPYADALTEKIQMHTILEARYNNEALTAAITADQLRPSLPEPSPSIPPAVLELTRQSWQPHASERPPSSQIACSLIDLAEQAGWRAGPQLLWEEPAVVASVATSANTDPNTVTPVAAASTPCGTSDLGAGAEPRRGTDIRELSVQLGMGDLPTLRTGVEASAGKRGADRMEDAHTICSHPGNNLARQPACSWHTATDVSTGRRPGAREFASLPSSMAMVVRSALATQAVRAKSRAQFAPQLPSVIFDCWPRSPGGELDSRGATAALRNAFIALNDHFLSGKLADDSGCTALAALCAFGRVVVANAGDCQCWLWRGREEMIPLNSEHIASNPDERARVEATGAEVKVTNDGKLRVQGLIQVTRCLGDRKFRKYGLISEPEVRELVLGEEDNAIVMASDGLWDVLTPQRVNFFMRNTAKAPDSKPFP